MSATRVTVLTDFGTADGYAAAMAGVVATMAPDARLESASHRIDPGDITGAALALSRYAFLYPPDTVHLVVVDPGVGTRRRALAGRIGHRWFVAPDNGVLTRVLEHDDAPSFVELTEQPVPEGVGGSATFHGRDVFAPVAARLARGDPLDDLGRAFDDPVHLRIPEPHRGGRGLGGEVIHVDRFGNLITNVPGDWVAAASGEVRLAGTVVGPLRRTYADVEPGGLVALVGSLGLLEISVRDGSAANRLGAGRGASVAVSL